MRLLAYLRSLVARFFRRSALADEMDEELHVHIELRADDLERSGLNRAEAERRARIEFGGYQRYKEESHEAMGGVFVETLMQDVRFALRVLRKGGILALAGVTMSPIPQMDYSLLYEERQIRSVANSTRQDVREFLELAAEIPIKTEVQVFDLEQANLALQALKRSEIKAAAVLQISRS